MALICRCGHACADAAQVPRQCDTVVLAVFNTEQVESLFEGPSHAPFEKRHLIICTSTCGKAAGRLASSASVAAMPAQVGVYEIGDAAGRVLKIGYAGGKALFGLLRGNAVLPQPSA